jgi:hypothetical protein
MERKWKTYQNGSKGETETEFAQINIVVLTSRYINCWSSSQLAHPQKL